MGIWRGKILFTPYRIQKGPIKKAIPSQWQTKNIWSFWAVPWNFSFSTPSLHWFFTTLFPKQTRPCRSWRSQDMAEDSYVLEVSNKKLSGTPKFPHGRNWKGFHFHDFFGHLFLEHGGKFGVNFCAWNLTWLRYRVQIWDPWLLLVTIRHVDSLWIKNS